MNLQQLYYFEKIAECHQYTQAANELHVTQATLSYAISNLEKELGVRLFERKGKSVQLTDLGKGYLVCVRDALQALARGEQLVRAANGQSRTLIRLECLESVKHLALRLLSEPATRTGWGHLRFDLSHSNALGIEQKLLRREIDLGISTAPTADGLRSRLIGYQGNVIVVPRAHPWAERAEVSLSALDGQRLIAYNQECVIRGYYESIFRDARVEPDIFAESSTHSNILDMVSYGMGVAIVPRMQQLEGRQDLVALPIREQVPPRAIYLLWASDAALPPEIERFRQSLAEHPELSNYL